MKNKSWIIILIMGIALTISIGYSVVLQQKNAEKERTVTTTSIIEMTATTATIKNTLKGTGTVSYKEENIANNTNTTNNQNDVVIEENKENEITNSIIKSYEVTLSVEEKDFSKVKENQVVDIAVKKENQTLNYTGKVKKIIKDPLAKSTIDIEITNPDDKLQAELQATCTIIIEKAENVVALPIEAIQKDEEQKKYVDLVVEDGTTTKMYIKTGISDDYYVEIKEGLNVGDRVQIIKSSTTVVNDNEKNILKQTSEK